MCLKGCYLDFSHLIEFINIHITEIFMKNNINHQELRIMKLQQQQQQKKKKKTKKKKKKNDGVPLKGYLAS